MLYGPKHPKDALPDASYVKNFYDRTRDLIDQHNPDLLYFDNALLPLGWGGMNVGAYFYNHNLKTHGKMEAVLNVKNVPDKLAKAGGSRLRTEADERNHALRVAIGDLHRGMALPAQPV